MKNVFLLFYALLTTSLSTQNTTTWSLPGAKWEYHYESLSGPGLEILEQVGTEMIGGQVCTKLHWYGYHNIRQPLPALPRAIACSSPPPARRT